MTDWLLTTNEAARILKITNMYLYRLAKAGEISFVRIGKRSIRFKESDLQRFVEAREKK